MVLGTIPAVTVYCHAATNKRMLATGMIRRTRGVLTLTASYAITKHTPSPMSYSSPLHQAYSCLTHFELRGSGGHRLCRHHLYDGMGCLTILRNFPLTQSMFLYLDQLCILDPAICVQEIGDKQLPSLRLALAL